MTTICRRGPLTAPTLPSKRRCARGSCHLKKRHAKLKRRNAARATRGARQRQSSVVVIMTASEGVLLPALAIAIVTIATAAVLVLVLATAIGAAAAAVLALVLATAIGAVTAAVLALVLVLVLLATDTTTAIAVAAVRARFLGLALVLTTDTAAATVIATAAVLARGLARVLARVLTSPLPQLLKPPPTGCVLNQGGRPITVPADRGGARTNASASSLVATLPRIPFARTDWRSCGTSGVQPNAACLKQRGVGPKYERARQTGRSLPQSN